MSQNTQQYNVSTIHRVYWCSASVTSCQAVHHASKPPRRLHLVYETQSSKKADGAAGVHRLRSPLPSSSLLRSGIFHLTIMTTTTQQSVTWRRQNTPSEPLGDRHRDRLECLQWAGLFLLSSSSSLVFYFFPCHPLVLANTSHLFSQRSAVCFHLGFAITCLQSFPRFSLSLIIFLFSLFQILVLLFHSLPCHMHHTHICSIRICTPISGTFSRNTSTNLLWRSEENRLKTTITALLTFAFELHQVEVSINVCSDS